MQGNTNETILPFKTICMKLQSLDSKVRKQTFIEMERFLGNAQDLTNQELRNMFTETHMYFLNGLRDKAEPVRLQALHFLTYLVIDKLPLNDFYLTYIFPVFVERIGSVEIIEESEEIRYEILQLLDKIITRYSNTDQLQPFLNDCVIILAETVKDKYPAIKELSCQTIINLSQALPKHFHMQAETLIKPVLTNFGHQRFKVRVAAINTIGEIVMHSSYKGLDEAVGPMAERLFDQIPIVRHTVAQNAGRWLLQYRDRYSFFHKILPLLLTGLNDEVLEMRLEAAKLWEKVGLQYQQENEKDLKDQLDYLIELPKYYPKDLVRPNLGCRTLVKRNISKLSGALARELTSWQADIRVRCSQLLCSLVLHAEEDITQNLQDILTAMYSTARDDDPRVIANIIQASEIIGCFVRFETWSELLLPLLEDEPHYGHLMVLNGLIKGSPREYINRHIEEISKILSKDSVCCSRKNKYQIELLGCLRAILEKYIPSHGHRTGYNLFKIIVSLIALKHPDNEKDITVDILNELKISLLLNDQQEIWNNYSEDLLQHVNKNPKLWTTSTNEACIFLTILSLSFEAFGQNLALIRNILVEVLDQETNAEMRLKTFYVLSSVFEMKEVIFKNASNAKGFFEQLIQDIFVPSLVWHPGATAEAIRTMAASCLQLALTPGGLDEKLFTADKFRIVVNELLPLLISLMEDASYRSRLISIDCVILLKENCYKKNIWELEDLLKVYSEILKRLDDPTDQVRMCALRNLPILFKDVPEDFKKVNFRAHHELIIDTLLIHFDDKDEIVQNLVYQSLEVLGRINQTELVNKLTKQKSLMRNWKGCEMLLDSFEGIHITED